MYNKIFNMAFSTIFDKYIHLIKALLIYAIISIVLSYILQTQSNLEYINGQPQVKDINFNFILYLDLLLFFMIHIMIAITTHRIIILGENSVPKWGFFKLTKREWGFIVNWLLIGLICGAMIIGAIIIGSLIKLSDTNVQVIIYLTMFLFSILLSRISLVFPAIAVDKEITLSEAWNYTKNYKLLVLVTVIIFPFIFSEVFGFVYGIAIEFLSKLSGFNLLFLNSILNIFITVFTISALSATYKLILEEHPEYFTPQSAKETKIKDISIENSHNGYKITIDDKNEYSFLELKDKIHLQYFDLGFDETVVDKEDVWMIRNPQGDTKSYVSLSHKNGEFIIEIFKAPIVDFLN